MTDASAAPALESAPGAAGARVLPLRWIAVGALLLALLGMAALLYGWSTQRHLRELELQLVKRQQDSAEQATQAQLLSRQAQEAAREAAAKVALLEARVAEVSVQRTQLEELIQSMSQSRDENLLADIDASIRVAMQQATVTGSSQPLLLALRQADDRLAHVDQLRLQGVRRALAQDIERVRTAGSVDRATLAIRLDEVVRQVDELPLLSEAERRGSGRTPARAAPTAAAASAPPDAWAQLRQTIGAGWTALVERIWAETRGLVRVTPIDHPDAMLLAPEQAWFLRENLKLRLLNARLSLMSHQLETAQLDLRAAQLALERYFDRDNKRVAAAIETLRQVGAQARRLTVPRPDATLAALAAAGASR